jgi:4-amino-4-deoxy-L-arabinose transferase-like glycosyltransferase
MGNIKLPRNPYLLFSPFLLLYIIVILILQVNTLSGDEFRYVYFADNMLHGFYSPPPPYVDIPNGPGYPILLMPFRLLHLPLLSMKLMNALFHYLAVVFLFKSLIQIVSFRKALIFSLFLGCYYITFRVMSIIYTEMFAFFLVSLLAYLLIRAFSSEKTRKYVVLSGLVMGYIALTKVIFGYVLLCMLPGCLLLWLSYRSLNHKKGLVIILIAFATTLPWLIYTFKLTGRVFYWTSVGGNNLYWLTAPDHNEYGNWYSDIRTGKDADSQVHEDLKLFVPGGIDSMEAHHRADYLEINKYTGVERDDIYKKLTIRNIKAHPVKYLQNCVSNVGRMLFDYPYSFFPQKPGLLLRLPPNGIIALLGLFCLIPTIFNWRKIIYPVRYMLFFALLYLGGNVLGAADIRMFILIAPMLLLWIAYIIQKTVKVDLFF